jgi:hypothetical protein
VLSGGTDLAKAGMSIMSLEGGEEDIVTRVALIKKKFKTGKKSAMTPTINAFISMYFLRALLTSVSSSQNEHLLEIKNFGASGHLSLAD